MTMVNTDKATLRETTVYLDAIPDEYHGFTKGEDWNGWECPYFPIEEALRIVEGYKSLNEAVDDDHDYRAKYDESQDIFRFYDPHGDYWEEFEPVSIDGKKLYPIGAFGWTWSEVSED